MAREASRLRVTRHEGRHAPVTTSRLHSQGRPSLLLEWQTDHGTFLGEATPLAGYGSDDIELAHRELAALDAALLDRLRASHQGDPLSLEELETLSGALSSPAARFALETIWLRARAYDQESPVWKLLRVASGEGPSAPSSLATSAVVSPTDPAVDRHAVELWTAGVRTFKIKCGQDAEAETKLIRALSQLDGVRLRLDPNLAWSTGELRARIDELQSSPIEFIEDPTSDPRQWALGGGVHLAIDEPLGALEPRSATLAELGVSFVILKPMALGGFARSLRWAQAAAKLGLPCIVSHLFDGPVALDAAVELAFAVQSPTYAAGLGRHAGLAAFPQPPRHVNVDQIHRPEPSPPIPLKS